MEDTLGDGKNVTVLKNIGLNPCFNGRYSRSREFLTRESYKKVLILVLMEDTLGVLFYYENQKTDRLNPCFNGRYSRRLQDFIEILNLMVS